MAERFNALILAAGFGTRMGESGLANPKGLIRAGEATILDNLINQLSLTSPQTIILITNQRHLRSYELWQASTGRQLQIISNQIDNPTDRLGALKDAVNAIERENLHHHDLLILPSDTLFDFPLLDFIKYAQQHQDGLTTIFRRFREKKSIASRLGCGVVIDSKLVDFYEKPINPPSNLGAVPFYYYPSQTLPLLESYVESHPDLKEIDAPGSIIPWLIKHHHPVYAYIVQGHTLDIGTPGDLSTAAGFKVK